MAKQPYGTSTLGPTNFYKGDLPADRDTRSYGPAPKAVGGKVDVQKPSTAKNQGQRPSWGTAMLTRKSKYSTAPYEPGAYAAYRQAMPDVLTKKFVTKKPAAVVKPAAKKLATVVSNVTNEKLSPAKKAMARAKPPATRFGVVTGKTTGTRVSGGGGYGGGGTRGSGSLSGGGSGTRSAGTSRTGGTQRNDPVRG
jgi:hypothetical protein